MDWSMYFPFSYLFLYQINWMHNQQSIWVLLNSICLRYSPFSNLYFCKLCQKSVSCTRMGKFWYTKAIYFIIVELYSFLQCSRIPLSSHPLTVVVDIAEYTVLCKSNENLRLRTDKETTLILWRDILSRRQQILQ